jgi:hypothetical protein
MRSNQRTAIIVGLAFVVLAAAYLGLSGDAGGATTLGALGIAMGLAAYALAVGSPDDA